MNTDWLPTLLDLAGAPAAPNLDGVSQLNVLRTGKPAAGARTFFWHIPHYTNQGSRPPEPFVMAAGSWSNTTTAGRWNCSISRPT